jgi:hypothetical protein
MDTFHTPSQALSPALQEQIELFVEQAVDQRLSELLGDPDEGLELREELISRLREQQQRVAAGKLGIPFDEVRRRLGLK